MPKSILVFVTLLIAMMIGATTAQASTIIFEDNFDNGLNKWLSAYEYFAYWGVVAGRAQITLPGRNMRNEIIPDLEWNDDWQYYRLTFDYYSFQGADKNINLGFTSDFDWYELHFVGGDFYLTHVVNNTQVWSYQGRKNIEPGVLQKFKIDLNRGRIIVLMNNELLLDQTDPTYNGSFGKPTLKATTGVVFPTTVAFDNYQITLMEEIAAPEFPIFKQTDPRWSEIEYDSASLWATNPSIGRWGCALSSLAMVLNFYDINKLPDGSTLNPETLNSWLKSQPDGYLGEGLLNWIAGTRLTRLMSSELNTPKLEYSRDDGNPLVAAKSEVNSGKPVILQIPGHFLAGHELLDDDIKIADPAFNYSLFSEHQKELLSTRIFTPSQTDLSYILITHHSNLNLQFIDSSLNKYTTEEYLDADSSPHQSSGSLILHELPKPGTNNYIFEISQAEYDDFELKLYLYDASGDVKIINYVGYAGPIPEKYLLNYQKDSLGESSLGPVVSFVGLANKTRAEYQNNNISLVTWLYLEKYLGFAVDAELNQTPEYRRYVSLIAYYLDLYAGQMSQNTRISLESYLLDLKTSLQLQP